MSLKLVLLLLSLVQTNKVTGKSWWETNYFSLLNVNSQGELEMLADPPQNGWPIRDSQGQVIFQHQAITGKRVWFPSRVIESADHITLQFKEKDSAYNDWYLSFDPKVVRRGVFLVKTPGPECHWKTETVGELMGGVNSSPRIKERTLDIFMSLSPAIGANKSLILCYDQDKKEWEFKEFKEVDGSHVIRVFFVNSFRHNFSDPRDGR
ncbi:MAG: hypothetical protein U0930_19665 [Pirellulales bacterium]